MQSLLSVIDGSGVLPLVSALCHLVTASVAVTSGIITYRYTKQQTALALLNHALLHSNAAPSAPPDVRAPVVSADTGTVVTFRRSRPREEAAA